MKWVLVRAFAGRWLAPALVLLVAAGIGGSWIHGYQVGKKVTVSDQLAEIEQLRQRAASLADELEKARGQTTIEYRDRIRTVYREPDPTGCADVAVPVGVLDAIRAATGQPADRAVREAGAGRGDES